MQLLSRPTEPHVAYNTCSIFRWCCGALKARCKNTHSAIILHKVGLHCQTQLSIDSIQIRLTLDSLSEISTNSRILSNMIYMCIILTMNFTLVLTPSRLTVRCSYYAC